jgi:uncharacterized protein YdhG (YjbR/CyaY superfamily)
MAKTSFSSVDQYLASQPAETRGVLTKVRNAIRNALPAADETISYQIPTYKLNGRAVIYFAGWRQHYSIYPATAAVVSALGDALAPYKVEKGTIRFPFTGRVPMKLIASIAKLRATEAATPPGRKSRAKNS